MDFEKWVAAESKIGTEVDGVPITRHWLIPQERRPKLYAVHPTMSLEEIRVRTQGAWDRFYSWRNVWARSRVVKSVRSRFAFVVISKLYRQMYANTGIATDSARVARSARWARWMATACRPVFIARPMPDLAMPESAVVPVPGWTGQSLTSSVLVPRPGAVRLRLAGDHHVGRLDDRQRVVSTPQLQLLNRIARDDRGQRLIADPQAHLAEQAIHSHFLHESAQAIAPAQRHDEARRADGFRGGVWRAGSLRATSRSISDSATR